MRHSSQIATVSGMARPVTASRLTLLVEDLKDEDLRLTRALDSYPPLEPGNQDQPASYRHLRRQRIAVRKAYKLLEYLARTYELGLPGHGDGAGAEAAAETKTEAA